MDNFVYISVCHDSQRPPVWRRGRQSDAEADSQTTTPGGPTASKSCTAARLCTPPAATVVKAIVVIPSSARADLYALLQSGEDSEDIWWLHRGVLGAVSGGRWVLTIDKQELPIY
jgi:hypothetical protein